MTWQPNMNHFVKHWLSDPAPPRHVPWFERDVRRPPPGWVIHLQNIPTADPTVAGPQDMGRGRGHHDLNLEQQLEARARVTQDTLTWLSVSASPYVGPRTMAGSHGTTTTVRASTTVSTRRGWTSGWTPWC